MEIEENAFFSSFFANKRTCDCSGNEGCILERVGVCLRCVVCIIRKGEH